MLVAATVGALFALILLILSLVVGSGGTEAQAVTVSPSTCLSPLPTGSVCLATPTPTTLPTVLPTSLPSPSQVLPSGISSPVGSVGTGTGQLLTKTPATPGVIASPVSGTSGLDNNAAPLVSPLDLGTVWQTFTSFELLPELMSMLTNPVSTQPPDLGHFQPPAAPGDPQAASDPWSRRGSHPLLTAGQAQLLALVMLVLLSILAFGGGAKSSRARQKAPLAMALLPAGLAALLAGQLLGVRADPLNAIIKPASAASLQPVARSLAVRDRLGEKSAAHSQELWQRLVTVEGNLTAERQQLMHLEAATRLLVLNSSPQDQLARQLRTPNGIRTVTRLITEHVAVQPAYEANLRAEYEIYQQAAQNPDLRAALLQHARQFGDGITEIVATNLTVVMLQAQQDALVNASDSNVKLPNAQLTSLPGSRKFLPPLGGVLVQAFGPTAFALEPPMEYGGTFYPHFHTGIDIAAVKGTPVHAAADGVVALVARMTDGHGHLVGYGNFITILHRDGNLTLYAHLDSVLVKVGQIVPQGQVIGAVGSTGWSTGPHLHFEIRHNGEVTDPLPYLQ
jgi:murein DD-endopeptidase MepM/ murein hydrolase activator NlpD